MLFENFQNSQRYVMTENRYLAFSPALFFVLLAVAIVLMPRLFLFLIATFFLAVGIGMAFLIWKVLQFKHKVDSIVKDFNGKVVIQGLQVVDPMRGQSVKDPFSEDVTTIEVDQNDSKKIIFH